jgi:small subunit ribosomal protein S1
MPIVFLKANGAPAIDGQLAHAIGAWFKMSDSTKGQMQSQGDSSDADFELFQKYLNEEIDLDMPGRGDLREGVIVEIRASELLVNVGSKRDGVVPQSDLARLDPDFVKTLREGMTVDVVVAKQPEDDGVFQLSMADALQQRDWVRAQELLDSGDMSMHKVVSYNKGGLTVEFNHLRGFVPASHILDMPRNLTEDQRRDEFEARIGQDMRLKVIEVDQKRRRLVMSQMLAEREYRNAAKEDLFKKLAVGDIVKGVVRSMRPFGAFVDIGGVDGLLHVSEIGFGAINHPREAINVGQEIDVQVIRIDGESQRVALSRKKLLANPWDGIESRYQMGATVDAIVTRLVEFGAFAQLEPGVEGLIHISELADITVAERQRIGLSLRQAIESGAMPAWSEEESEAGAASDAGAATGEGTGDEADAEPGGEGQE